MADNVAITAGSGTSIATDDVSGTHYQIVKLAFGALDTATLVASGSGLPVSTGTVTVTGSVAVSSAPTTAITASSLPLPSGAATESTLSTISGRLPSALSGGGRLTVDATGTVAVSSVSGTVAISASSLPLPTSAATETSVAASATSLAIIDDWDESDRCKTNPIVGQAGVAAGAGAVSATTQRATLASDDPAVVSLSVIDDWDESDRAKVNPIVGQAGVAGGSGTVGATTQRVCLATDVALPAGTNTLGSVYAIPDGGSFAVSGSALTPKRAAIAASSSGNNTLIAAVASKKIRVLALWLVANGSVNAKLQDGAGGTDMTGLAYLVANTGFVLPFNPLGWCEGTANTLLNLNLSAAVAVGGSLVYVEV